MDSVPDTCDAVVLSSCHRGEPAKGVTCEKVPVPKELKGTECLVKMAFSPINPSDVNVCEGVYLVKPPSLPATPGFEGSGTVIAVGPDVTSVSVGDAVCHGTGSGGWGWNWGAWKEYNITDSKSLRVMPPSVTLETAAVLAANPATAYGLLSSAKAGDWIIQNAGNSGMGGSVIQVAKCKGIKTCSIVRREGLADGLKALGADVVVVYSGKRDETTKDEFAAAAAAVKEATGGAKIHLALNAVCGLSGELLAKCLAPGGTVLTYGVMSKEPMSVSGGQLLFKDITYTGFHLSKYFKQAGPEGVEAMWQFLLDKAASGDIKAPPFEAIYPLSEIGAALANSYQSGRKGKVLLKCSSA